MATSTAALMPPPLPAPPLPAPPDVDDRAWLVLPLLFFVLAYAATMALLWPYGRRVVPFWFLLFAFLLPPLLPFVFLYVFLIVSCVAAAATPVAPVAIVSERPVASVVYVRSDARTGTRV